MEINPRVDISKYAGEGAVPERADEAGGAGPGRQGARHKLRLYHVVRQFCFLQETTRYKYCMSQKH